MNSTLLYPWLRVGFQKREFQAQFSVTKSSTLRERYSINSTLTPIDVSNYPDMLRLAEEVRATRTPRVLKRDRESIAVVMPLATALSIQGEDIWKHYDAKRVQKALKESAGALTGIDKKALMSDIAEQRTQNTHGRFS